MGLTIAAELEALLAAAQVATQARLAAHERIVRCFRVQLRGAGTGPCEADLQRFARLLRIEQALQKELDFARAQAEATAG